MLYTYNVSTYEFTFVLGREPTDGEVEALFEPFDGSAVPEFGDGAGVVHVHYVAGSLAEAIGESIVKIESVGLPVTGVESEDAVSIRGTAARAGRSYESVRLWALGRRGPGGFPAAVGTGQWALYSWAEVSAWMQTHGVEHAEVADDYDREFAAADHLVRARHLLHRDERADMARLATA